MHINSVHGVYIIEKAAQTREGSTDTAVVVVRPGRSSIHEQSGVVSWAPCKVGNCFLASDKVSGCHTYPCM